MKTIALILIVTILMSCNNHKSKHIESNEINTGDSMLGPMRLLDSLNLIGHYEESKWKIYLKYCDYKISYTSVKTGKITERYFGECDVVLFSARLKMDSLLSLLFQIRIPDGGYFISDRQFLDSSIKSHFYPWHYYNIKNGKFYGYGFDQGIKIDSIDLSNFCNNIRNCKKEAFIIQHRAILNKWFVNEAIKRKLISPS